MAQRPIEHIKAQRAGRKRDGYVCQICGSPDHTEGHHLIDYRYGGAANKENIITLCHNCHQLVHKGKLDLLTF